MKTVCIVQARRRSVRLPDKVLMDLGGKPALMRTLERCLQIANVDEVVLAGIDDAFEQPLFDIADSLNVSSVRGSSDDLVSRYCLAAEQAGADIVMRVTADCPLLDPGVCASLVSKRADNGLDYANTHSWPHGLDCEVFTRALLEKIASLTTLPEEREHVTLWVNGTKDVVRDVLKPDEATLADHPDMQTRYRWVLDYPEDYDFLSKLFEYPQVASGQASWRDIVDILDKNPSLQAINASVAKEWHEQQVKLINASILRKRDR